MNTHKFRINGFTLVALVCLTLGLFIEFSARFTEQKEVREASKTLQLMSVSIDELETMVTHSQTPVVLYVYASWCGVCHKVTPYMMDAMKADNARKYIFLSMDAKPESLRYYLTKEKLVSAFTSYILTPSSPPALAQMLEKHSGKFTGGIPYIAEFKSGKVLLDSTGVGTPAMVNHLK